MSTTTMPTSLTIELDWSQIGPQFGSNYEGDPVYEGTVSPEEMILSAAARQIAEEFKRGHPEVYRSLARQVQEMRDTVIREHVTTEVEKALAGPIQRTNTFGEPSGQATTLREMVMTEVQSLITQPRGDRYDRKGSVLEQTVKDVTEAAFRRELNDELKKVKAQLSGIITDRAAKVLGDALVEATADNSLTARTAASVTR